MTWTRLALVYAVSAPFLLVLWLLYRGSDPESADMVRMRQMFGHRMMQYEWADWIKEQVQPWDVLYWLNRWQAWRQKSR